MKQTSLLFARFLVLAVVGLLFASSAHADDTFHRTLSASAQPDLYVSTGSGDIRVVAGASDQIEITGHVHAGWIAFGDVRSRIDRILANPPIRQSGNSIYIGETSDRSLFNDISIDYVIQAPAGVALNLHTGSGDVVLNGVGRFLSVTSGSGDLNAQGVHGPAVVAAGSGDITLSDTAPGDIKARSGSGTVHIFGLDGSVTVRTGSGDIQVAGRLSGSSTLFSGSGDVKLQLSQDSHFSLEATTGSGDIRVHIPGVSETAADSARHHVTVSVNGGGAPLEIHTGSGDITLSPQ